MVSCTSWIASLTLLVALGLPGLAAADELGGPETQVAPAEEPAAAPEPRALPPVAPLPPQGNFGDRAIEDWSDRTPWGYGTDYLFPLTRGMEAAGVPRWARYPLYPLTVPLDLIQLGVGAIGGLWGD
jgi:hypothetical protein